MLMRKNKHVRETVHDVTKGLLYEDKDVQEQLDSRITFRPKRMADEDGHGFGGSWIFICHSLLLGNLDGAECRPTLWYCL